MIKKIEMENGYLLYEDSDFEENTIEIDEIEVYKKRKGTGTELINKLIEIAQKEGKNIKICAKPLDDSITTEALVEFYKKLGFFVDFDDGICYIMKYEI